MVSNKSRIDISKDKPTSSVISTMADYIDRKTGSSVVDRIYEFIEKFLCILCHSLLYPPMQMTCCGQRICQNCANTRLPKLTQCTFCLESVIPKAVLDRGFQRELDKQQLNCPRCNQFSKSTKELPEHLETHRDIKCDGCEQKFIFSQQLDKHQQHDCQHRKIQCPLAFMGCSTKIEHNKLADHYQTNKHQKCLVKFILQILPPFSEKQVKKNVHNFINEKNLFQLKECQTRMEQLLRNVTEKLDNCSRLHTERQAIQEKLEKINGQLTKNRDSFEDGTKILQSSQEIISAMQKMLEELKSKPMGLRLITTDGKYIFKVSIQQLTDGDQSFQSESIHSSQSGYKMALFYETYTDKQSKQRYLSISFAILKGEFDAILFWPMVYPVTISIIALNGKGKNISYPIPQDSRMRNFQKPVNDVNPPVKISEFCLLDEIIQQQDTYIQDNSIYIEFKMDFETTVTDPMNDKAASRISSDSIERSTLPDLK